MWREYLKEKKEFVAIVLLWLSGAFGAVMLIEVAGYFVTSASAGRLVARAVSQGEPDPNDIDKYTAKFKKMAEQLKKKNFFVPPKEKKFPVEQVSGILGDSAIINGKMYKVGDKVQDAKIVRITPTYVEIEWQGRKKTFSPFEAKTTSHERPNEQKRPMKRRNRRNRMRKKISEEKVEQTSQEDPLAWMEVKLSPALRAKLLEKWNSMSDEEKQNAKEQWSKMSDEQKQKATEQMEENIDNI